MLKMTEAPKNSTAAFHSLIRCIVTIGSALYRHAHLPDTSEILSLEEAPSPLEKVMGLS